MFCEKETQKQILKSLELKKLIKRKSNKLYIKWKGYDSSFESWIGKKGIV